MAAAYSGIFVFLATMLFSDIINRIPTACLSSIVMVSAIRLIDFNHMKQTWKNSLYSKLVLLATFISTMLIPLQYAIFAGTGLSIILYLYESKNIKISYLKINDDGDVLDLPISDFYLNSDKNVIINIEGSMYFGSVSTLEDKIEELLIEHDIDILVFYMRSIHSLASTMMISFNKILQTIEAQGIEVYICGISDDLYEILLKGEIDQVIDLTHIYKGTSIVFESLKKINNII